MPVRNIQKQYDTNSYYHVYNRGVADLAIFLDFEDKRKFLQIIARHLDKTEEVSPQVYRYEKYDIEMITYCLMGNHFHFLLYISDDVEAVTKLMRSVATAYTMYFNHKYNRRGHLFQSIFKASRISNEAYLMHITRYIHMNPRKYLTYRWSSLRYYLGEKAPPWLHVGKVNDMSPKEYQAFLDDYQTRKEELEILKDQLAL